MYHCEDSPELAGTVDNIQAVVSTERTSPVAVVVAISAVVAFPLSCSPA